MKLTYLLSFAFLVFPFYGAISEITFPNETEDKTLTLQFDTDLSLFESERKIGACESPLTGLMAEEIDCGVQFSWNPDFDSNHCRVKIKAAGQLVQTFGIDGSAPTSLFIDESFLISSIAYRWSVQCSCNIFFPPPITPVSEIEVLLFEGCE